MSKAERDEVVDVFAEAMKDRLDANIHKGSRENWLKDSPYALHRCVEEKVRELFAAIYAYEHGGDEMRRCVMREAVNVANFAAMIADRCDCFFVPRQAGTAITERESTYRNKESEG